MTAAWIDARNSLPAKHDLLCVVFDPGNDPTVWPAQWDANNRTFVSNGGWFEIDEITHWMPLPAAPAIEGDGLGQKAEGKAT